MANKKEVDALNDMAQAEQLGGALEVDSKRKRSAPGTKLFFIVFVVVILIVGALISYRAIKIATSNEKPPQPQDTQRIGQVVPALEPVRPTPAPPPANVQPVTPIPVVSNTNNNNRPAGQPPGQPKPPEPDPIRLRMLQSGLGDSGGSPQGGVRAAPGVQGDPSAAGELEQNLKPMRLSGSRAGLLQNRDYLITQGTMIDCALETRIISTQAGMISCYTTRDTYSASGRMVMIDRGSKVTGFYQGGILQGQARIFVQWIRVETPEGVVINLDSPGTGPLGEAGLGGYVDTHFWQRFGGAILLSIIGDVGDYLSNEASSNDTNINVSGTSDRIQDAVTEALKNSINIPPTLYKNQDERISIFVARDLDFSGVYSISVKPAPWRGYGQ